MSLTGEEIRRRVAEFAAHWGGYTDLRELLDGLDRAVAGAYGWPSDVAADSDERNRRLLDLNRAIAAGDVEYAPFAN